MAHPEYEEMIELRAEGELDVERIARLDQHLAGCEQCRQELRRAEREVELLRTAHAAPEPPPDFEATVLRLVRRSRRHRRYRAAAAGVAANLITAAILLLLSLGSAAPFLLMLLVALAVALLWGALKGLAFGACQRYLPANLIARGVLVGFALWIVTNVLLALSGGPGPTLSLSFTLAASLAHYLLYGLLLSWLYAALAEPGGPLHALTRGRAAAACILLAAGFHFPAHQTPTLFSTPTSTASVTAEATATGTPPPTASPTPVLSATPTVTISPTATTLPTPVPSPTPPAPKRARAHRTLASSPLQQAHAILPNIVRPNLHVTPRQRVRDIVTLLDFL